MSVDQSRVENYTSATSGIVTLPTTSSVIGGLIHRAAFLVYLHWEASQWAISFSGSPATVQLFVIIDIVAVGNKYDADDDDDDDDIPGLPTAPGRPRRGRLESVAKNMTKKGN